MSVGVCLTVADSKRAFHSAFPHVIAPIYRRLVDELLVELHLLSHQKGFQADGLFAVGLTQVFDSFSKGYRPDAQREPLFQALCSATGFDGAALRSKADQARRQVGHHSLEEVKSWLSKQGEGAPELIAAHEIGEAMGLIKDRVDKDLGLYASNIEKMSQAVELMEETVAAERRRRERAAESSAT